MSDATINAVTVAASLGAAIGGVGVAVSGAGAGAVNIIQTRRTLILPTATSTAVETLSLMPPIPRRSTRQ